MNNLTFTYKNKDFTVCNIPNEADEESIAYTINAWISIIVQDISLFENVQSFDYVDTIREFQ